MQYRLIFYYTNPDESPYIEEYTALDDALEAIKYSDPDIVSWRLETI